MQEQELAQLILSQDPQVNQLRSRAIAGNQQLFQTFISVLSQMLDTPKHHEHAYK